VIKMSFSSDIKQELNKTSNLANKSLVRYELIGYLLSGNVDLINEKTIRFSTESDYNINRFSKLLSNLEIDHNIDVSGKIFFITLKVKSIDFIECNKNNIFVKNKEIQKEEEIKAIIRGMFLGSGSINNPERKYHFEIVFKNKENLEFANILLAKLNINTKMLITENKYSLYIKEGEEISKILALLGANKAVMKFEEIRVQREMRGKVNRIVNCETANLNKTINASIEQIAAIKKLQKDGKFSKLDDKLKEIAILRLENPDLPLTDLGKMLKEPVGKSGVNYRLKKIMEIAAIEEENILKLN